mmetsp:Transcript_3161/g.3921  ORF Transcript_3161/g.3921 Transcript_3161/m.3921 type:complete len:183 (+) Transcript_3161:96-644(+)|eukprot:CAMPEP_0114355318 /NCGR_PEP_ID=MMETSP0101-20121206/20139_1 /TAXON_ID=38822 ORGANISM="Pteridomonas danica, Strain PT" /NCGR_SAMPLE_ID=MMETSP0101 /ASSEMBLY_ACC=CAM_ASM_000211 /LENGTH=182 /DNA_ID=CAMNT_0001497225 /DNA_START=1 /DNA_END=549 /DNA_ORIENTATION=-
MNFSLKLRHVFILSLISIVNADEDGDRRALPQHAFNKNTKNENIKWTAGDNSGKHASAPRSQRYWNEHNLNKNKPDYAKTDAEVFAEKWGFQDPSTLLKESNLVIGILSFVVLFISVQVLRNQLTDYVSSGQKLGTSQQNTPQSLEEVKRQERISRLAKFEESNKKTPYSEAMAQAMGQDID